MLRTKENKNKQTKIKRRKSVYNLHSFNPKNGLHQFDRNTILCLFSNREKTKAVSIMSWFYTLDFPQYRALVVGWIFAQFYSDNTCLILNEHRPPCFINDDLENCTKNSFAFSKGRCIHPTKSTMKKRCPWGAI